MWKKALWVYTGLYLAIMVFAIFYNFYTEIQAGEINWVGVPLMLFSFLPGIALVIGLRGKKVPILLTLFSLLVIAIPVAGIFTFNNFSLLTIGKFLLFVPMIIGLIYFGIQRFRKESTEVE
jgi:hypothetical protein